MSDPDAREPLDTPPSPTTPPSPPAVAAPGEEPAGRSDDLAAIPAFLRGRLAAAPPPPGHEPAGGRARPGPGPGRAADVRDRAATAHPGRCRDPRSPGSSCRSPARSAEASASSARAEDLRAANAALTAEVAASSGSSRSSSDQRYISSRPRGPSASATRTRSRSRSRPTPRRCRPTRPGSAAARLGADEVPGSPLERWLDVLFGPAADPSLTRRPARSRRRYPAPAGRVIPGSLG